MQNNKTAAKGKQINYFNLEQLQKAKQTLKPALGKGITMRKSKLPISEIKQESQVQRISNQMRQSIRSKKSKTRSTVQLVIWVQSKFRMNKIRKQYKEMLKKFKYRRSVIQELITTEQGYVTDLGLIINNIMNELKEIITKQEMTIIFSNITSLKKLNEDFLKELKENFDPGITQNLSQELLKISKTPKDEYIKQLKNFFAGGLKPYAFIGPLLLEFAPYFKIYFQYYNDFPKSQNQIEQLKKENKKFTAYIQQMSKNKELRFLDLESYLVKPVQRLPKYVLLIKDLLKHTDQDHPDYEYLVKAYDTYNKVTEENNQKLDKLIKNAKIFELQKIYCDSINFQLVDSRREYLFEKLMKLFWKNKKKSVHVYFFSDLLLVTERKSTTNEDIQYIVVSALRLSNSSQVNSIEDTQHFQNLFTVIGKNDSVIFIAKNQNSKEKILKQIQEIIDKLKDLTSSRNEALMKNQLNQMVQSLQYKISVQILGTEKRQQLLNSYTVYDIEIFIENISQKVYLRFSELMEIQNYVKKKFPKLSLAYMKEGKWTNRNDIKEIEARSLQITNFLQTLLTSQVMGEDSQDILQMLTLPANFYQLPEIAELSINDLPQSNYKSRKHSLKSFDQFASLQSNYNSLKDSTYSSCELSSSRSRIFGEKKLSASQISRSGQSLEKLEAGSRKQGKQIASLTVSINSFCEKKECLQIQVNSETRILDLYEIVTEELCMMNSFDFKFLVNEKSSLRPVGDEELVLNLFTANGIIDKIRKAELLFKKYIFLDMIQEEQQLNQDPIKQVMVYRQFQNEIKNSHYVLLFKEYCLLAALFFFIEKLQISKKIKFPFEKLSEIIPPVIIKSTKKEIWQQYIIDVYNTITDSLLKEIKDGTQNPYSLAQNVFIDTIYQNQNCGLQFFLVSLPKETQFLIKHNENKSYLAVGYKGIIIYDEKKRSKIADIEMSLIQQIKSFTGSIQITDSFERTYKFETNQGIQIQNLLTEYQDLLEDLKSIQNQQNTLVNDETKTN